MKTLHLIKTSHGATWAWRQVRELVGYGHEVHVALPDDGPMASRFRDVGAVVHFQPCDVGQMRGPGALWAGARQLRRLVRSIDADIVHSHFVGTTLLMRLALRGLSVPRLFQVPGLLHLENRLTRLIEGTLATRQDYWAASCRLTREIYIRQGIEPERIGLAYYGTDFVRQQARECGALRSELGISPACPIIGMVAYAYAPKRWLGYKRGIKGHEDLIDALALLHGRGIPAHGVFVGGAWTGADEYYRSIVEYGRQRLRQRGHFLGTRHDVASLYPEFDVAVHPSHSENLGGAVESLAMAVPTITTDVGGFPDIIVQGETGWRVPAKNPCALADAIQTAIERPDRAREMATKGQTLVRDILDVRNSSAQLARIYAAIAEGRPLPC